MWPGARTGRERVILAVRRRCLVCHWLEGAVEPEETDSIGPGPLAGEQSSGGYVDEKALFMEFWSKESETTARVLARIPEGSDYRPDPRSRTAREIAWQIVAEEKMLIEAMETGVGEWAPGPLPETMRELCETYGRQSAEIARRWQALPASRGDGTLDFFGTQRPASPMAWSFLFDIVHHRGQITTYLRPMGSTVPQIYGPSGDEP